MEYYVCKPNGEPAGPVREDELREWVDAGGFSPSDFACAVGETEWRSIRDVLGLAPTPPPPPPPPSTTAMQPAQVLPPPIPVEGSPPPVLSYVERGIFESDTPENKSAYSAALGYITRNETIQRIAVQKKLATMTMNPDIVVGTDRRLMILRRGFFSVKMWDAMWVDIVDVRMEQSIMGVTFFARVNSLIEQSVSGLPLDDGLAFYRYAQEMEERARVRRHEYQIGMIRAGTSQTNINIGR